MAIATRLAAVEPQRSNRGCVTCQWFAQLSDADRAAFDEWVTAKRSLTQLWQVCQADEDYPLTISLGGFRTHVREHHRGA